MHNYWNKLLCSHQCQNQTYTLVIKCVHSKYMRVSRIQNQTTGNTDDYLVVNIFLYFFFFFLNHTYSFPQQQMHVADRLYWSIKIVLLTWSTLIKRFSADMVIKSKADEYIFLTTKELKSKKISVILRVFRFFFIYLLSLIKSSCSHGQVTAKSAVRSHSPSQNLFALTFCHSVLYLKVRKCPVQSS